MTMDFVNTLIDASIRGTLLGISVFFWGCGLIAVWKWIFGLAKRFFHWLCPNFRKNKTDNQ